MRKVWIGVEGSIGPVLLKARDPYSNQERITENLGSLKVEEFHGNDLIIIWLLFRMVMITSGGDSGFGSGSGVGTEPIDERMREFISL